MGVDGLKTGHLKKSGYGLAASAVDNGRRIISVTNGPGLFGALFQIIHGADRPWNAWPSLHVSTAALITIFSIHWWKERPVLQWSIGILWILMCISILTTKQHFIWDLVTGLLLTAGIWRWQIVPGLEKIKYTSTEDVTS